VSRRRALVGGIGLLALAVLVLTHAFALTMFLWESATTPVGAIAVGLLWAVSATALFFVARGMRHAVAAWRDAPRRRAVGGQRSTAPTHGERRLAFFVTSRRPSRSSLKVLASLLLGLSALASASAIAQDAEAAVQAQAAASAWLALVDAGNYSRSWELAAGLFKSAVGQASWATAAHAARAPLGPLRSREVKSAVFTRTLPGAPDGEYVVITYASRFQNEARAIEIVTPLREKDGAWRVSGYFVK
jgi:hypothetical protein